MNEIERHLHQVSEALTLLDVTKVQEAVELIRLTKSAQGTVWIAGNGGSAATASHFANDLTKMAKVRAVAISDLTPTTLAYGNDDGWDRMFANALIQLFKPMDCVVGISCSGNSMNVVNFVGVAIEKRCIALTGPDPSRLSLIVHEPNVLIHAMSDEITVQEDIHSIICHSIARRLR